MLRGRDWSVPSVLGWQYSYTDVGENTGRVMFAKNTASSTAAGQRDDTLDRSYDYDHLGRLIVSHSGYEARLHMNRQQPGDPTTYGPYSQAYGYDQLGNMTVRYGWGGWDAGYVNWAPSYTNNRLNTNPATGAEMLYEGSGNLTNDGYQSYTYDAHGQQAYASGTALTQSYDGNGVRAKKTEGGATTYYLRSSVLGGQVIAEINSSGAWTRGYVYAGGQMIAVQQQGAVYWMNEDPVPKSKRVTDIYGSVVSTIDLDPWGGETATGSNQAFQPHRFTNYERDANSGDEAMMRRYTGKWHRFYQPDPYDGSYNLGDPQSFNRYAYTQNDPVNFVDPTGLMWIICQWDYSDGRIVGGDCFGGPQWGGFEPKEGGGTGGREPQNTQQPNPDIEGLLENPTCRDFLNSFLDEISKFAEPYSHDFRAVYNAAKASFRNHSYGPPDTKKLLPMGGTPGRIIGDPYLEIFLDVGRAVPGGYAALEYVAIHDIVHAAKGSGTGYNHLEFAVAAYNVAGPLGLLNGLKNSNYSKPPDYSGTHNADVYNSNLFDKIVFAACPPKKKQ